MKVLLFLFLSLTIQAQSTFNSSQDWFQQLAEGGLTGYSSIEKFGENPAITTSSDPEDVWDGGGLYSFSTTADIDSVVSDSVSDGQLITIIGLDSSWEEVTQTATLNGQTAVALTTSLIRVYRAYNSGATNFAGQIYVFTNATSASDNSGVPSDLAEVRAQINDGANQTLMSVYTVPAGKTGYFWGGYVTMATTGVQAQTASFTWRARLFGSVFAVKSKIVVSGGGSSWWNYTYKAPIVLPEKTDVLIRCDEVSATMGVSGGFTVILKDD